ncbi:Alpha/Beta hydrolase protein [Linnemannia elongata]|nr:Alpha/Beta hydrolase protein [Linnemannia elongata]
MAFLHHASLPDNIPDPTVGIERIGDSPIVNIPDQGAVQGTRDELRGLTRYLGIPFAVVNKRWRKAASVKPWLGVRDATRPGPLCPQILLKKSTLMTDLNGLPTVMDGFKYSERDCLNLDIYAPVLKTKPEKGIPVMVLMHGGKFRHGGNGHPMFDASNFVQASVKANLPVIVVVPNYRLGYLGFFSSKELALEFDSDPENIRLQHTHDQDQAYGNWGIADQRLAFEWVQRSIAAFGGCPSNVTAMGYSSGGNLILHHMRIKSHHGLFTQAIIHSSPACVALTRTTDTHCQKVFDHLCDHFKTKETLPANQEGASRLSPELQRSQMLRDIPAECLVQAPDLPGFDGMFSPIVDNKYLFPSPESTMAWNPTLYDSGVKSVLFGSAKDEGTHFTRTLGASKLQQWQSFLDRWVDTRLHQEVEAIYGKPKTDAEAKSFADKIVGDIFTNYPTLAACQGLLQQEGTDRTVYRYYVDRPLEAVEGLGLGLGVPHGTEMAQTLMSDMGQWYLTEVEREFGHRVMERYFRFVHGHGFKALDTSEITNFSSDEKNGGQSGARYERMATVWSSDLTLQAGVFERMDERTRELWRRNDEWTASARSSLHRNKITIPTVRSKL